MSKENLINMTCRKYKLTKEQLADKIGASASTIRNSASSGEISEKTKVAIELFLENQDLKEQVQEFNIIKQIFSKFTQKGN